MSRADRYVESLTGGQRRYAQNYLDYRRRGGADVGPQWGRLPEPTAAAIRRVIDDAYGQEQED